jgi:hypothetical protein
MSHTVTIPASEHHALLIAAARAEKAAAWLSRAQGYLAQYPDCPFARASSEAAMASVLNLTQPQQVPA